MAMTTLLELEIALDGGNVNAARVRRLPPACTSAAISSTGGARPKLSLST
ncbi:hypothetical protein HLI01_06095 [Rhizobium laguerreae]|nr:hypothetical protein [Rhizobium laguerreae]NNH56389.1 hypothetical protein [Rhizobium laguerreae]